MTIAIILTNVLVIVAVVVAWAYVSFTQVKTRWLVRADAAKQITNEASSRVVARDKELCGLAISFFMPALGGTGKKCFGIPVPNASRFFVLYCVPLIWWLSGYDLNKKREYSKALKQLAEMQEKAEQEDVDVLRQRVDAYLRENNSGE